MPRRELPKERSQVGGGGKPGSFHRSAYPSPPLAHAGQPGVIADASAILVELGQSGGPNPHGDRSTSLLSRQLDVAGFDVATSSDLAGFDVPALHPGRTLIEKPPHQQLRRRPRGPIRSPRVAAHRAPVLRRLGAARNPEVLDFLADKPLVTEGLASCYQISQAFTPDLPAPEGGFAASPAFDASGPLAPRLRTEHDAAMAGLHYGNDAPPGFDDVLARVHEHQDLLDPGTGQ